MSCLELQNHKARGPEHCRVQPHPGHPWDMCDAYAFALLGPSVPQALEKTEAYS